MTHEHDDHELDYHEDLPPQRRSHRRLRKGFGYITGLGATIGGGVWTYKLVGNADTVRALSLTTGGLSWLSYNFLNRPDWLRRKEVGNNTRTAKIIALGALSLSVLAFSMSFGTEKDADSKKATDNTEQSAGGTDSTTPGVNSELDCPIDFTQIGLPEGQGDAGAISVLQLELRDLDYYPKRIDGEEGPLTRGALDAFEVKNGLDPAQPFSETTCDLLFSPDAIRADA